MWATTTIRVERAEVVDGEPAHVWALLSSPAAWSLWPHAPFMFDVPGTEALRLYIGRTPRGLGSVLLEVSDQVPGAMVRLLTLPTGRQEYTLSVAAGRRGTSKVSVRVKEIVPRRQERGFEQRRRKEVKGWLSAIRAVIEGRARWPGTDMPTKLLQACLAQQRIEDAQDASASVLINADPATVWDAVHSPETARDLGESPPVYSGYVPGTPQGEAGEMQYFVSSSDDGRLTGQVIVVPEAIPQRSALACVIGGQLEQHYLLTPESDSGATRLDLTFRWPAPKGADAAAAARSRMAAAAEVYASGYRSLIEAADGPA